MSPLKPSEPHTAVALSTLLYSTHDHVPERFPQPTAGLKRLMKPIFLALCIALSTQLFAQSGNFKQSLNGGTLNYQVVYAGGACGTGTTYGWSFGDFTYTDSNGYIWTLVGGGGYIVSSGGPNCPPSGPQPSNSVTLTGG